MPVRSWGLKKVRILNFDPVSMGYGAEFFGILGVNLIKPSVTKAGSTSQS